MTFSFSYPFFLCIHFLILIHISHVVMNVYDIVTIISNLRCLDLVQSFFLRSKRTKFYSDLGLIYLFCTFIELKPVSPLSQQDAHTEDGVKAVHGRIGNIRF